MHCELIYIRLTGEKFQSCKNLQFKYNFFSLNGCRIFSTRQINTILANWRDTKLGKHLKKKRENGLS